MEHRKNMKKHAVNLERKVQPLCGISCFLDCTAEYRPKMGQVGEKFGKCAVCKKNLMIDDFHGHLKKIGVAHGNDVASQTWSIRRGVDTALGGVDCEKDESETRWNYCVEACGTRWNLVETGWNWCQRRLELSRLDRVTMFRQEPPCAHALSRKTSNQDKTVHVFFRIAEL